MENKETVALVVGFIKDAMTLIESMEEEIKRIEKERDGFKTQVKKQSDQKVILDKVASEKSKSVSKESIKKLAGVISLNTTLDEDKVSKICRKVEENPDVLVDLISDLVKEASTPVTDGKSIEFMKTSRVSKNKADALWEEAAKVQ